MAVSLNSVVIFNSTQCRSVNLSSNIPCIPSLSRSVGLKHWIGRTRSRLHLVAAGGTTDNDASEVSNDVDPSSSAKASPGVKKASLTARERLRAARVLSRYTTESKPSKPELGSRLLDALKESDKGKKRPGLPEAPTNIFDDSKRGMPKEGWTIELPGGMDVFFIILSFLLISTVMFATTYIVWKVGAIHFNEY